LIEDGAVVLAGQQRQHAVAQAGKEHLVTGGDEGIDLHLPLAREDRPDGPTERREQQAERAQQLHGSHGFAVGDARPD